MHACCMETEPASHKFDRWPRLWRIVTCNGPNQRNQSNLDLYLVQRYTICHFPIVVSYLCNGQNQKNQKNQPKLVLYLVRRSKIFVSVATLYERDPSSYQEHSGAAGVRRGGYSRDGEDVAVHLRRPVPPRVRGWPLRALHRPAVEAVPVREWGEKLTPNLGAPKSIVWLLYSWFAGRWGPKSAEQQYENQFRCSQIRRHVRNGAYWMS